jgi:arylsulfatase A-like enzyme
MQNEMKRIGKMIACSTITALPIHGAVASQAAVSSQVDRERPNIILIMTDQQTADAMSNRGNQHLNTPAMDRLAADGIVFTRAYCAYPLSGPSRASIMTGKMPNQVSVLENNDPLPDEEIAKTLGFTMQAAGYDCLYAGKWHIPTVELPDGEFGFRKVCGMYDPDMALHIDRVLSEERDKPFFLVASYLNPHEICEYARSQTLPYGEVTIPDDALLPELPANFNATDGLPELLMHHKRMSPRLYPTENYTERDWRNYLYAYHRLVERVDAHIAELIQLLEEKDLYDNSVIIFTSDHGEGVAAHRWNQKRALFEETTRIPLIVKPPKGEVPAKQREVDALVNTGIDLYPTLCDYGNASIPAGLHGISLKGIINGTAEPHPSIFIETHLDAINGRAWCVIKGDYKYAFYRFFKNREQLFDLSKDRGETTNLVDDPEHALIYQEMKEEMKQHAKRIGDKMLIRELK